MSRLYSPLGRLGWFFFCISVRFCFINLWVNTCPLYSSERGVVIHSVPSNVVKWLGSSLRWLLHWNGAHVLKFRMCWEEWRPDSLCLRPNWEKARCPKMRGETWEPRVPETRPSWGSGGPGSGLPAGNHGGSALAAEEATWDSRSVFSQHISHESLCCYLAGMHTGGVWSAAWLTQKTSTLSRLAAVTWLRSQVDCQHLTASPVHNRLTSV